MAFTWEDEFCEMLLQHDIQGTSGCSWPKVHNSILVSPIQRILTDDSLTIMASQFFPEGLGFHSFSFDVLEIPTEQDANQTVLVEWQSTAKGVPIYGEKVFLYKLTENHAIGGADFTFHEHSQIFPLRANSSKYIHMLEFFSGGYGGWKRGSQILADGFGQFFRTMGLEQDLHVASTYAISHCTKLVGDVSKVNPRIFRDSKDDWVICCDIWKDDWIPIAAEWGTDIAVISAPCKPWSGAASAPGLYRADGRLLVRAILACRFLQPRCIAIEQVLGFGNHDHKKWVLKALICCGYQLIWSRTIDLVDQSPSYRPRWLGVAVRLQLNLPIIPFQKWKKVDGLCPKSVDAIWTFLQDDLEDLQVSDEAFVIARDKSCYRGSVKHSTTPASILANRVYSGNSCLPTFMALYGSQHGLDREYLQKHGFFGHYKSEETCPHGIRYWHPIEVALIHGLTSPCFIDDIFAFSWLTLGNMIAQPHALLVLTDICNRCFAQNINIDEVMSFFQQCRFRAANVEILHLQGGSIIHPKTSDTFRPSPHRDLIFRLNAEQLLQQGKQGRTFTCWTPRDGIIDPNLLLVEENAPSEVTIVEIPPTVPFEGDNIGFQVLQWFFPDSTLCRFHVRGSIPLSALGSLWGDQLSFGVSSLGFRAHLNDHPSKVCGFPLDSELLVISKQGEIFIVRVPLGESILSSTQLPNGPPHWNDAFDRVVGGQTCAPGTFLCDFALQHGTSPGDAPFMMAAFSQCYLECTWDAKQDDLCVCFQGSETSLFLMNELWVGAITPGSLTQLGRKVCLVWEAGRLMLHFTPLGEVGACPPFHFRQMLSICATRALLDVLHQSDGSPVTCKILGRPLWVGLLPSDLTLDILLAIIRHGFQLIGGRSDLRVVCRGKQVFPEAKLSDLSTTQGRVVLHFVHELSGGGPSKNQTRTHLRNAIAGAFLEQGYDIQWVSVAVETLVNKVGIPRLQNVANMTPNTSQLPALHKLCAEVDLKLPNIVKLTSQTDFSGAPWNKKKNKREPAPIRAADFTITPGFFQHEDGTPAVQLPQLRAQACGVCILDPQMAVDWLKGNNRISSDELGPLSLDIFLVRLNCQHLRSLRPA